MELTVLAQWLNDTFASFDHSILAFFHWLATTCGDILTPVFKVITFTGEGGWLFIVIALALLMFAKTRRSGVSMALAIILGAVVTNVLLKNIVARPRPYEMVADFRTWWEYMGSIVMSDKSFPSGHTNIASTAIVGLWLSFSGKKRAIWASPLFIFIILMGMSRLYLVVHYPTDVIGGLIFGSLCGVLAYFLTNYIYRKINNSDGKFARFVKTADIRQIFRKTKGE